jgi:hypothetical protein
MRSILFLALMLTATSLAAAPTDAEVKEALVFVHSSWCGNTDTDKQSKIIQEAGGRVLPLLTELIADDSLSPWFYGSASYRAKQEPFSEAFRHAMRARREDERFNSDSGSFTMVFDYFAAVGDESDLRWMRSAKSRLDSGRLEYGERSVQALEKRLKEAPNQTPQPTRGKAPRV